jgi:D-beta-D-heptose 7-phosphate kinase / D-beta-D-heptose 1-phosphate adenosyltransferase
MRSDSSRTIDAFAGLRVLVLGDAILDRYLEGGSLRFSREAPVPNVTISQQHDTAGGGGNTAVNVAALGARVDFLGVLGDDPEGGFLSAALRGQGVGVERVVVQAGRRTRAKHRVVAESQLLLSYDGGDVCDVDAGSQRALIERLRQLFAVADAVILADYGYGTFSQALVDAVRVLQQRSPRVLVVDSRHRLPMFSPLAPTAVKPNYEELKELLAPQSLEGFPSRAEAVQAHAEAILSATGAQLVAATLDCDGAVLLQPHAPPRRLFNRHVPVRNAAGAGDSFVATLALALAAGAPSGLAGELAAAAATVAVSKDGTAPCTAAELHHCFSPAGKHADDLALLAQRLQTYRDQGRTVVFTNGCFDILHRGHVTLLNQARSLGDVLIVGVNSDASIRRLKGPGRPINTLEDRVQVLAALACVDHVIGFDEDTCSELVRALRPHIFVKGGDYTRETLPEAPVVEAMGGVVHVLPYLSDRSTTGLIERIKQPQPLTGALSAPLP